MKTPACRLVCMLFLLTFLTRVAFANPLLPLVPPSAVQATDYPGAVWEPASPANFQPSQRPSPELPIDMIVIHDIEGTASEAIGWFQNPMARASSHYVVDGPTGRITQMIRERDIAWHAGDRRTNARSIGIEHGGFAYRPGFYNPVEYEASAHLVRAIALRYAIPRDRTHIIGHFEVPDSARPGHFGGRSGHTDPGPYWDWDYFLALVRNDARLDSSSATSVVVLHPGETATAAFTLFNTGDDPWPADPKASSDAALRGRGPVYLGVRQEARGNKEVQGGAEEGAGSALSGRDWVSPRFAVSPEGGETAPGAAGRFVLPIHAPTGFLGPVTETFRLFKVPTAPHLPVPFGPTLTVFARVLPWDLHSPVPAAPPGWAEKTLPGGLRVLWCKTSQDARRSNPPGPVRWRSALPMAGAWDVFVRWPPGLGRTARAAYQVKDQQVQDQSADHQPAPGNTKTILVNQRQGGGEWRKLGRFRFGGLLSDVPGVRPGASRPAPSPVEGTVVLLPGASAPGVLAAESVRFVGPFL